MKSKWNQNKPEFAPDLTVQDLWKNGTNPDIRFVVDEKHKILYCELPKVGCTNWKRTMLQLIQPDTFGRLPFDHIKGLNKISILKKSFLNDRMVIMAKKGTNISQNGRFQSDLIWWKIFTNLFLFDILSKEFWKVWNFYSKKFLYFYY